MSELVQIEKSKIMTLKDKLKLIADTIRNHGEIKQCGAMWVHDNKMCVYGLLAFRSGESIYGDIIQQRDYSGVLNKYGITQSERRIEYITHDNMKQELVNWLWYENDYGLTFEQIADALEKLE